MLRSGLLLAVVVVLLLGTGEAGACSIVPSTSNPSPFEPRALLDDARTVLEAEVTEVRDTDDAGRRLVGRVRASYRTTRTLRGTPPATFTREVRFDGPSCDVEAAPKVGDVLGFVDGDPVELGSFGPALRPYPAAAGRGTAAVLVAGRFGGASVVALDRAGSVVGYGFGGTRSTTALSVCPGRGLVVQGGDSLLVRRVRDLGLVREGTLGKPIGAVRCLDRRGDVAVATYGRRGGRPAAGVSIVRGNRVVLEVAGPAYTEVALGRDGAVLVDRRRRIVRVGYRGRGPEPTGLRLPSGVFGLELAPDGRRLLGRRFVTGGRTQVVLLDLADGRTVRRTLAGSRDEFAPRVPETLDFDLAGRPRLGFRGRLTRLDLRLRPAGLLAAAERFAAGSWTVDATGRLHRGRTRLGPLPRRDAGPLAPLGGVTVDAGPRVPTVL